VSYTYEDGGWGVHKVGTREEAERQLYAVGMAVVDVGDKRGRGQAQRVS
jgi:hypothetical protein